MLDEPPLIVRTRGLTGIMDEPFVILRSKRSQLCAGGLVIRVKNASDPQTSRNVDENRGVFDIDDLLRWRLGDVQREPKDVGVGLADVNKAGGNKSIYKPVHLELANAIRIHRARFVADHGGISAHGSLKYVAARLRA
jgi:hypothetical protein